MAGGGRVRVSVEVLHLVWKQWLRSNGSTGCRTGNSKGFSPKVSYSFFSTFTQRYEAGRNQVQGCMQPRGRNEK